MFEDGFEILKCGKICYCNLFSWYAYCAPSIGPLFLESILFMGNGHGDPLVMPRPCSSCSKELSIEAFIWGIVSFCTTNDWWGIKPNIKPVFEGGKTKWPGMFQKVVKLLQMQK